MNQPYSCLLRVAFACLLVVLFSGHATASTFRIFALVGTTMDLSYKPAQSKEFVDLAIYSKPSKSYPMPDGDTFDLYREVTLPASETQGDNTKLREIVASISIPGGADRYVIVLMPKEDGHIAAMALKDDFDMENAEVIRLMNFSSMPVAFQINDTMELLDVGESTAIDVPSRASLVQQAVQKAGSWIPVMSIEKRFSSGCRYTYMVFDYLDDPNRLSSSTPQPVMLRSFVERVPKPQM